MRVTSQLQMPRFDHNRQLVKECLCCTLVWCSRRRFYTTVLVLVLLLTSPPLLLMRQALLHNDALESSDLAVMTYDCSYCKEPHTDYGKLQLNGRGSFCTWECMLAQGLYLTWANNEDKARRHQENVTAQAGRKVYPAPAPLHLARYDSTKGMQRAVWLPLCRGQLPWSDANVAHKEGAVPGIK